MKILSFDVGIVNLAYCIFDTCQLKILHWEVIKLENIKDHGILHVKLIEELDKRKHMIDEIDTVLIEKQPSFNPKMRIIAGCLQTYFFIRGVIDSLNKIKKIKFFSPKHKLKCFNGNEIVITGKTKYAQTKQMGIIICREKLKEYNEPDEIKQIFEDSKKKDDLADCYLQAITYSIFEKLIAGNTGGTGSPGSPGTNSNHSKVKITIGPRITNVYLKNKLIEHINTLGTLGTLENIDSKFKEELSTKFKVTFPLTESTLKIITDGLKIKKSLIQGK